jgi:hypothetical protein
MNGKKSGAKRTRTVTDALSKSNTRVITSPDGFIVLGDWYWCQPEVISRRDSLDPTLHCVVHIGSNYALLRPIGRGYSKRVHFNKAYAELTHEPAWKQYLDQQVLECQNEIRKLLSEINQLTHDMGVSGIQKIGSEAEDQALTHLDSNLDSEALIKDLVNLKRETLPELFEKIERRHERLAEVVSASLFPLKTQVGELGQIIKSVDEKIFNIKLYAGLVEDIVCIKEGERGSVDTQIVLMQRQAYMDEEALLQYESGGMDFRDLDKFDEWLSREENFKRLLPFDKTVLSFKVRRHGKDFTHELQNTYYKSARDLLSLMKMHDLLRLWNKYTFLYIRNGESLYRVSTEIDFGKKLFPNPDAWNFNQPMYFEEGLPHELITQSHWESLPEVNPPEDNKNGWPSTRRTKLRSDYVAFNSDSVYFDDVEARLIRDMKDHNKIALVLQGLLDRSDVLHPHPPIKMWDTKSFNEFIRLILDNDKALYATESPPDFRDYVQRLNSNIGPGSFTIGQHQYWEDLLPYDSYTDHKKYPPGNRGPDIVSEVMSMSKKGVCTFEWNRDRQKGVRDGYGRIRDPYWDPIPVSVKVPVKHLFNVSDYKPGDFKVFFNDPRTREKYLDWAPLFLKAEEWHQEQKEASLKEEQDTRSWNQMFMKKGFTVRDYFNLWWFLKSFAEHLGLKEEDDSQTFVRDGHKPEWLEFVDSILCEIHVEHIRAWDLWIKDLSGYRYWAMIKCEDVDLAARVMLSAPVPEVFSEMLTKVLKLDEVEGGD